MTNSIEVFRKKKGNKVELTFSVTVDDYMVPSAVSTIRRKLTAIDMNKEQVNSDIPIFRPSVIPMAG